MRRLLLALMIVLLPLRGWVGDAMAMEVTQPGLIDSISIASMHHSTLVSNHFGQKTAADLVRGVGSHCEDLAAVDATAAGADGAAPAHGTCGACSVCHAVALQLWTVVPAGIPSVSPPPAMMAESFASAETRPARKPPIS